MSHCQKSPPKGATPSAILLNGGEWCNQPMLTACLEKFLRGLCALLDAHHRAMVNFAPQLTSSVY
ncbi:hypothetical protein L1049_010656 [Liquidambar formosana]|uniref:Uncharacterized protein n=1 Tax=Liquidambar formosana TaxID=63359 RepID=A0AAP0R512_LIQFO